MIVITVITVIIIQYFARDCGVAYPTVERSLRVFPCNVLLFQERASSRKIFDKFSDGVELSEQGNQT